MRFSRRQVGLVLLVAVAWLYPSLLGAEVGGAEPRELVGQVTDARGQGVPEAKVYLLRWRPEGPVILDTTVTDNLGNFAFDLPPATVPVDAVLLLRAAKAGWHQAQETLITWGPELPASVRLTLIRAFTPAAVLAALLIVGVLVLTSASILPRTLVALSGAALMLFISYTLGNLEPHWFILSFPAAVRSLDFNVFFGLLGLMFFAGGLKQAQILPWLVQLVSRHCQRPGIFVGAAGGLAFCLAALLTPWPAVWLLLPLFWEIGLERRLPQAMLLLPVAVAAHLGGLATLPASPINFLIGSHARLTLPAFLQFLLPLAVAAFFLSWGYFSWRHQQLYLQPLPQPVTAQRNSFGPPAWPLLPPLVLCAVFSLVLLLCEGWLKLPAGIALLTGAMLLVLLGRLEIVSLLAEEISWPLLVYLLAAFMLAAGAQATGLVERVAVPLSPVAAKQPWLLALIILGSAALLATFLEPLLLTVLFLALLSQLQESTGGSAGSLWWWALAVGINFGSLMSLTGYGAPAWACGLGARLGARLSLWEYVRELVFLLLFLLLLAGSYLYWLAGRIK